MTTFPLRLTEELKAIATAQAARAGVSLNQYIATALAAHVDAQAEAEHMFAARAAPARPGTARAILARAGKRRRPRVAIGGIQMNCTCAEQRHCCGAPPCAMTIHR